MNRVLTIGVLPKSTENAYFVAARKGAEEATAALGTKLRWDGPRREDPPRQAALVAEWSDAGVDVIAVAVSDSNTLSPALRQAQERGAHVITWDSDAAQDVRELHVAQAHSESIGQALASEAARVLMGRGEFAIITATATSPNQNAWIAAIKTRIAQASPHVELVEITPCNEDSAKAEAEATRLLLAHPNLGAIFALCSPALLSTASAVQRCGRAGVKIVGTGAPPGCRPHIQSGLIESIVGWNPADLGYLTINAAHGLATGSLRPGEGSLAAGRLGHIIVRGDEVRLGRPHVWSRANLDQMPA
jgi:ABC-type sugar transport system substrate-binding protein